MLSRQFAICLAWFKRKITQCDIGHHGSWSHRLWAKQNKSSHLVSHSCVACQWGQVWQLFWCRASFWSCCFNQMGWMSLLSFKAFFHHMLCCNIKLFHQNLFNVSFMFFVWHSLLGHHSNFWPRTSENLEWTVCVIMWNDMESLVVEESASNWKIFGWEQTLQHSWPVFKSSKNVAKTNNEFPQINDF